MKLKRFTKTMRFIGRAVAIHNHTCVSESLSITGISPSKLAPQGVSNRVEPLNVSLILNNFLFDHSSKVPVFNLSNRYHFRRNSTLVSST